MNMPVNVRFRTVKYRCPVCRISKRLAEKNGIVGSWEIRQSYLLKYIPMDNIRSFERYFHHFYSYVVTQ